MSNDTHDLLFAQRAHHQVLWYRKTSWNVHRHQGSSWPYTQENCPTSCPRWLPVDGSAGTTLKLGTTLQFPVWLPYPGKHSSYSSLCSTSWTNPSPPKMSRAQSATCRMTNLLVQMESHLSSSSSVTQTSSSKYRHTYKKEDRHDCNNYRGISLLSVVRKMFAHLILLCLRCVANWILPGSQARFCPNRSTLSMILSYSSPATAREMHCTFYTYTHKMCTFLIIAASFLFFLVYTSFYIFLYFYARFVRLPQYIWRFCCEWFAWICPPYSVPVCL